jgi:broad specificity phosphatase PhoE
MPALYLLRHGQASFGAADYDRLSDLGRRQAQVAGAELARRGVRAPVVVSGTLARQRDTAEIAAAALGVEVTGADPRWNEYEAHRAVDEYLGGPGATDGLTSAEFQRHLDVVITRWIEDRTEFWSDFAGGAVAALGELAASLPPGSDAVVATSAGLTAALVGSMLGASAAGVVSLNRVSVNASITTIVAGSSGLSMVSFNDHAHLLGEPGLRTTR